MTLGLQVGRGEPAAIRLDNPHRGPGTGAAPPAPPSAVFPSQPPPVTDSSEPSPRPPLPQVMQHLALSPDATQVLCAPPDPMVLHIVELDTRAAEKAKSATQSRSGCAPPLLGHSRAAACHCPSLHWGDPEAAGGPPELQQHGRSTGQTRCCCMTEPAAPSSRSVGPKL